MKKLLFLMICTSIVFAKTVGDIQLSMETETEPNYNSAICTDVLEVLHTRLATEQNENVKDSIVVLIHCFENAQDTGEQTDLVYCFDEKHRLLNNLK